MRSDFHSDDYAIASLRQPDGDLQVRCSSSGAWAPISAKNAALCD